MHSISAAPRQRRKEARPHELVEAALELFAQKGFAATRSDEVAARAGVSKGTLYLYFPSKEDLLIAVIREHLSSAIEHAVAQVERFEGSSAELLRRLLTQWWIGVLDSPSAAVFKIVITEVRNFPSIAEFYDREVVRPGNQLIGGVIERGIARGEFRPVDVPSVVLSLVLPMVMLCVHQHSLGACPLGAQLGDSHGFIRGHIDLVLRGLEMPAARPRRRGGAA